MNVSSFERVVAASVEVFGDDAKEHLEQYLRQAGCHQRDLRALEVAWRAAEEECGSVRLTAVFARELLTQLRRGLLGGTVTPVARDLTAFARGRPHAWMEGLVAAVDEGSALVAYLALRQSLKGIRVSVGSDEWTVAARPLLAPAADAVWYKGRTTSKDGAAASEALVCCKLHSGSVATARHLSASFSWLQRLGSVVHMFATPPFFAPLSSSRGESTVLAFRALSCVPLRALGAGLGAPLLQSRHVLPCWTAQVRQIVRQTLFRVCFGVRALKLRPL
jgi:hypothetical protein